MTTGSGTPTDSDDGRSARKSRAILDAATEIFLEQGYLGTSMDEIAARARVSKQTVYKHVGDKKRLFIRIVVATVEQVGDPVYDAVLHLAESGEVEADLRDLARRQLSLVMQPKLLRLRRLVIGEATRFPDLGRTFYERGLERTIQVLTTAFEGLAGRGLLEIADPRLAAEHFNWLVMSVPLNRAMLTGNDEPFSAAELDRYADAGVRVFVAAYGRP
ncbi:MAG: TetR/AcrR family transcriptional regulator [Mycobacteriales bacterium]